MRKRALAGLSGHHLEQKRLRRKEEGNAIYDPDSMERDETNVEKNGCNAFLNGDTETHAEVNSIGRIAEASAIRLFSSQKDYSSSDAVPNKEDDTLAGSLSSYSEQSMLFTVSSAFLVADKDCQASNLSQSDQASLYEVDQAFTSYDTSSEANHAAKVNNHLSSDISPVEKDRLRENSDIEFEGSSIHEKLENYNDLKSTSLKQHNTSLNGGENNMLDFTEYSSGRKDCQDPSLHDNLEGALGSSSPIDVIGGYSDSNKMIIEPDFSYDNLNSGTSELAGGILEIKNNIISETVLQSYSIEGPFIKAIVANEDIIDRNYPSCSTEVEGQPVIDSIPLLTECRNDDVPEKAFQKSIQAKASEKMNCTVHENLHERSFSSAISIEINKKIPYANFKLESSLPPSPITGVIDCLVGKPNGENTHLDSFNEEETSFSFQMLNKSFSKENPRNEISFEMQGALEGVVESCHGSQNLTEQHHPLKVVAIDFHGDMTTQQKERKASVPFNSTSKDDSLSKDKSKVVQEIGAMRPERSVNCCTRKTLLVLDLNGILCDIVNDYHNSYRVEKKVGGKPIFKRPFCDDFLKFCFDHFYIGIWSSRRKYNVDSALDYLMGDFKDKLLFCWDQSKCTYTGARTLENHHKPLVLKELRKLWNKEDPDLPWEKGDFSPSNTLLLDDSPYKALCNPPHTAIFPFPYQYTDERDNSLGPGGDIRVYLEQLVSSDDVQNFVEEHPFGQPAITASDQHWYFYCQIIKSNSSQL